MEDFIGVAVGSGMGLLIWGLMALTGFLVLGVLIFWVWMIVDCAQRDFPEPNQNQKIVWILVIVLAGWIGALIYFLVVKVAGGRKAPQGKEGA